MWRRAQILTALSEAKKPGELLIDPSAQDQGGSGRSLGGALEESGIWEESGKSLGGVWEALGSGRNLGGAWEESGRLCRS